MSRKSRLEKEIKKKNMELKKLHDTAAREGYISGQRGKGGGRLLKTIVFLIIIMLIIYIIFRAMSG